MKTMTKNISVLILVVLFVFLSVLTPQINKIELFNNYAEAKEAHDSSITTTEITTANTTVSKTTGVFTYQITGYEVSIISCDTTAYGDIVVPETIENLPVKRIEDNAFENCQNIISIIIPDCVIYLGSEAFYNCSSLSKIVIGNGVQDLYYRTFDGCVSLTDIVIGNSVSQIPHSAFYGLKHLKNVTIGSSVKFIDFSAFQECTGLKYIEIPDNVEEFYYSVFQEPEYGIFYGCTNLEEIVIGNGIKVLPPSIFGMCTGLKSVKLGNAVTEIKERAFVWCSSLESVTIPDAVEVIQQSAFYGCSNLKKIIVPDKVKVINNYTFYNCIGLESIVLSESLTTIKENAFRNCKSLKSITLTDSISSIEENAFKDCESIESIYIGDELKSLSNNVFDGCKKLKKISVSENNKIYSSVDDALFSKDKTLLILAPIGKFTANYPIPKGTVQIGTDALLKHSALKRISIPKSLKNIAYGVFSSSTKLTDVYYEGTEEEWNDLVISANNDPIFNATIHFNSYNNFAHKHILETVEVITDCNSIGEKRTICNICDEIISTEDLLPPNHSSLYLFAEYYDSHFEGHLACYSCGEFIKIANITKEVLQEATCNKKGIINHIATAEYKGKIYTETYNEEISSLGHNFSEWVTTKEPTLSEPGERERLCSVCHEKETEDIDVIVKGKLTSIRLVSKPEKLSYQYKEAVSKDGIKVIAVFTDGSEFDVTKESQVTGFDTNSTGGKIATVEYEGCTATVNYNVEYTWWQQIIRILLLGIFWY